MFHLLTVGILVGVPAWAEDLRVLSSNPGQAAPGAMMEAYLNRLAHAALGERRGRDEQRKDPQQLRDHQARLKEFFRRQLGGCIEWSGSQVRYEDEPAAGYRVKGIDARVVGRMDGDSLTPDGRPAYRVEKILFESWPGHHVSAALYLPAGEPPYPGVLVPCGHSANGKAAEAYQRVSILLARNGLAALCYDPIGQGERYQILDAAGKPIHSTTVEHTLIGVGSILLGTNTARYRIHDGMRAIDYLCSRPDIDPQRIGCTGNSGGGTLTSYLMALDERIVCAAPSCYLTTFGRLLDTLGPQDAEQNIFGQIAFGMDHPDYVIMRAPKPTLLCVATRDTFDIGGSWDNFRQAKRFYTRLGHSERVDLVEADAPHGFSIQLRVAAVRWMRRWLLGRDDAITEADFPIWKDEELRCSPQGQVLRMENERSIYDLNAAIERELAVRRKMLGESSSVSRIEKVREITGVRPLAQIPKVTVRPAGTIARGTLRIEKLVLVPEEGIVLPALLFVPPNPGPGAEAYLYLNGMGKEVDAGPGGPIETLAQAGHPVLAVDVRGLGETRGGKPSKDWSELFGPDWKDFFRAFLLGKSFVGMRTEDLLACARFLSAERTPAAAKVHLIAIGEAGIPALHAAALEPDLFESATVRRTLSAWSSLISAPLTRAQLTSVVHGALRWYDLPDLVTDKVRIEEPLNPTVGR